MAQAAGAEAPSQVAVITTLGCPYCRRAKAALGEANIAYEEIELSGDLDLLATVKRTSGQSTVPQVGAGG